MTVKISGFIEGTQPKELLKLLMSLASNWGDEIDTSKLKAIHLSGAMTNVVYRITWSKSTAEDDERVVLVRIYGEGSDIFFDREDEIRTFESISTHGHGPRLLARFPEGRVEEFIHAKTLSASDLRDPEISTLIAAKMREFHGLNMPGAKTAVIWPTMRKWLIKAKSLCSQENAKEFQLDILEKEIDTLEKELSSSHQDVVFCHNDLQYGNIMMEDETRIITLIDYEYASYNPAAYDLANHFCEWAANYHTDTPHVLDYNLYPDLEERKRFVQSYLSSAGRCGAGGDRRCNPQISPSNHHRDSKYSSSTTSSHQNHRHHLYHPQMKHLSPPSNHHCHQRLHRPPPPGESSEKVCKATNKTGKFYEFRRNSRSVKSKILHFQLRNLVWATSKHDVYYISKNSSVLHWSSLKYKKTDVLNVDGHVAPCERHPGNLEEGFTRTQASTIAVKDNLLVSGGFQGELICKYLDRPGVSFCTRTTYDENAITNALDIYTTPSGAVHFTAANNDCGVRDFDMEKFQITNHF